MKAKLLYVIITHLGDLKPSRADLAFTKRVETASLMFGIELVDHLIIAGNNYKSIYAKKDGDNWWKE